MKKDLFRECNQYWSFNHILSSFIIFIYKLTNVGGLSRIHLTEGTHNHTVIIQCREFIQNKSLQHGTSSGQTLEAVWSYLDSKHNNQEYIYMVQQFNQAKIILKRFDIFNIKTEISPGDIQTDPDTPVSCYTFLQTGTEALGLRTSCSKPGSGTVHYGST